MHEQARQKVLGPAIGLMVMSGIGALWSLFSILTNLLSSGITVADMGDGPEVMVALFSGAAGIVMAGVQLTLSGVIIFGAVRMKNVQSYPLAVAVSVMGMIPCLSPCCCLGLPLGVWSLVVLLDAEVKRAFEENAT